jgi:hypothetical protein
MNRKQLAEMIKEIRRQKLDEIIGKPGPFDPAHRKGTHGEDPQSSNQYYHVKEEDQIEEELGGTYHKRKRNVFFQKKIPSERKWQKAGQQRMKGRYDEQTTMPVGKTDTGKASDVVDVSPSDKNSVNKDYASGNNRPLYANASPSGSSSTINGSAANTAKYYGNVWGVSETEAANTSGDGMKVAHAGWVSQKIGSGPLATIRITSPGSGINAGGFLSITGGANANISYAIANSQNTLQSFSTNPAWNVVASVTINNPGDSFKSIPTIVYNGANSTRPTFTATLGGRGGRISYETLVAMGTITLDNTADNTYFPGT